MAHVSPATERPQVEEPNGGARGQPRGTARRATVARRGGGHRPRRRGRRRGGARCRIGQRRRTSGRGRPSSAPPARRSRARSGSPAGGRGGRRPVASPPPSTRTRRSTKNCPRLSRRYMPSAQSGTASWAFRPAPRCRQPLTLAVAAISPRKRITTSPRCLSTCSPSAVSTVSARASTGAVALVAVEIGAHIRPPWIASATADRDRPSQALVVAVAIASSQVATGTGTDRVAGRPRADARRTADRGHRSVTMPSHARPASRGRRFRRSSSRCFAPSWLASRLSRLPRTSSS